MISKGQTKNDIINLCLFLFCNNKQWDHIKRLRTLTEITLSGFHFTTNFTGGAPIYQKRSKTHKVNWSTIRSTNRPWASTPRWWCPSHGWDRPRLQREWSPCPQKFLKENKNVASLIVDLYFSTIWRVNNFHYVVVWPCYGPGPNFSYSLKWINLKLCY